MTTKQKLIEVASRLFAERGFDGVSVRDIIHEAGANLGAVTYHFGSKDQLFEQVLMSKTKKLREIGEKIARSDQGPEAKLRAILEAYAFHVLRVDPSLKVLFAETVSGTMHMPPFAVESIAWRNRMFCDIVREGVKQGVFRKCDLECAAWGFFGMLSSYILYRPLSAGGRLSPYPEEYVRRIVNSALDIFMNGLLTRGSGARGGTPRAGKKRV